MASPPVRTHTGQPLSSLFGKRQARTKLLGHFAEAGQCPGIGLYQACQLWFFLVFTTPTQSWIKQDREQPKCDTVASTLGDVLQKAGFSDYLPDCNRSWPDLHSFSLRNHKIHGMVLGRYEIIDFQLCVEVACIFFLKFMLENVGNVNEKPFKFGLGNSFQAFQGFLTGRDAAVLRSYGGP